MTISGQRQCQAGPDSRDRRLCLVQSVYLGGYLVTTRDGYRPPIRLHCHPAQYAAVDETSRKYRNFLKKLLDAFRAEQRTLQFFKILPVIFRFINHGHTRYLMRDLAHPPVIFYNLLPIGSRSNAGRQVKRPQRQSAVNHTLADMGVFLAAADRPLGRVRYPDWRIWVGHNELTSVTESRDSFRITGLGTYPAARGAGSGLRTPFVGAR